MIKFIKILAYPLTPDKGEVFDYLVKLTDQSIDPPSLTLGGLVLKGGIVFCSSMKRAVECVEKDDTAFSAIDILREIPFKLNEICSKKEWEEGRSVAVRKGFKQAFIEDRLLIKRKIIFKEIRELLNMLKRENHTGKPVFVVSHSFRLKLIEAYLFSNGEIEANPSLINDYMADDSKTYKFGEGFDY